MVATASSGLPESSGYVGFFTIGVIGSMRLTLPRARSRELILRHQITRLKRLLANKTLQVDFLDMRCKE